MKTRHISLKDLAKELNVSISTVSRALKDHPDISPELRDKVKKLAVLRNYSPNPLAMGLLKNETKMIGVIVPDLVTHFYASVISGIESYANKNGYFIIIASSDESADKETQAIENLLKARVDGFIICLSKTTIKYNHFISLLKKEIPLVFFDRVCLQGKVPQVSVNNKAASQTVIKHLYNQGYRRIAFITGPSHLNISKERFDGYISGLKECNLPYNADLVVPCSLSSKSATGAIQKLFDLKNPPDAVFCINDTVAFAVMLEIKRMGLVIPDDIGLVGFTDDFHATVVDPQLTSVTHPTFEIGRKAADLFFQKLRNPDFNEKIILKTSLVIRKSSLRK